MIEFKNSILTATNLNITSADTLLKLQSDIECIFVGILHLDKGITKTLPFTKTGNYHTSRLVISEDDFKYITNPKFSLMLIDGETIQTSATIPILMDTTKIRLDLKIKYSKEIQDLTVKLNQVSKTLNDLLQKGIINGINILGYEYVKPGMVPIAIDDKGNCMFQYPLANIISELNGLKTSDGTLRLEAKDIPTGKTDVETRLNTISTTITELGKHIQGLANTVKELSAKVGKLDYKIASHLDTSIV
jgi:hypothetical protein